MLEAQLQLKPFEHAWFELQNPRYFSGGTHGPAHVYIIVKVHFSSLPTVYIYIADSITFHHTGSLVYIYLQNSGLTMLTHAIKCSSHQVQGHYKEEKNGMKVN